MRTLLFALPLLSVFLPAPAYPGEFAWLKTTQADLDGDGKPEPIEIRSSGTEDRPACILKVGMVALPLKSETGNPSIVVVDIDSSDRQKEILASTGSGDNDFMIFTLVRYDGLALVELGSFPGMVPTPVISGNGVVLIAPWTGFFSQTEKYVLEKGKLRHVPQEIYYVGKPADVVKTAPLYQTRDGSQVVANLAVGSTIEILGFAPSPKTCKRPEGFAFKECDWFLVRSSTGLVGWIRFSSLNDSAGLPWAG